MIYSYQQKNKFPHLLLESESDYYYHDHGKIMRYEEKAQWMRDNIGKHNIKWTINYGYLYNGQKIYMNDFRRNSTRTYTDKYVRQWCFLEKADAVAFKLMWL